MTGQDSTGVGTKAAAINQVNADWRSAQMVVKPGEQVTIHSTSCSMAFLAGAAFVPMQFFTSTSVFLGETVQFSTRRVTAAWCLAQFYDTAIVPAGATIGDVRF